MTKRVKVVLTKKMVDEKIARVLVIKQNQKELDKEVRGLMVDLEDQYKLTNDQKETIRGLEYEMEKVPVNAGRNAYDNDKLTTLLKGVRGAVKKVMKVQVVKTRNIDHDALWDLVKAGKITEEQLASCRMDNWTFRSNLRKIEEPKAAAPAPEKKTRRNKKVEQAAS